MTDDIEVTELYGIDEALDELTLQMGEQVLGQLMEKKHLRMVIYGNVRKGTVANVWHLPDGAVAVFVIEQGAELVSMGGLFDEAARNFVNDLKNNGYSLLEGETE